MNRSGVSAGLTVILLTSVPWITKAQNTPVLSGEDAVNRVKSLLVGFGVRGELRLQKLSPWEVVVTNSQARSYTGKLSPDAHRAYLFCGSESEHHRTGVMHSPANAGLERHVRSWMASVGTRESIVLSTIGVDEKGIGHASFSILRNGRPFVSARYGYDFSFVAASGRFLSFKASENAPPVTSGEAKLDKNGAFAALKRIWDTEVTPDAINKRHWRRVWYELKRGEPELGYYLPYGSSAAILVWRIRYVSYRDDEFAIRGGYDGMLIDAVTGRRVATPGPP